MEITIVEESVAKKMMIGNNGDKKRKASRRKKPTKVAKRQKMISKRQKQDDSDGDSDSGEPEDGSNASLEEWENVRTIPHHSENEFEKARIKVKILDKAMKKLTWVGKLPDESQFSSQALSENQKRNLKGLGRTFPRRMFRVASLRKTHVPPYYQPTKGIDSGNIHIPAVLCKKYDPKNKQNRHIGNNLVAESYIIQKIGYRLLWRDRNSDPFLSWTHSLLFVLVLGTCREARKELGIRIFSVDTAETEEAQVTEDEYKFPTLRGHKYEVEDPPIEVEGPAKFYPAEQLLDNMNVRYWDGWKPSSRGSLSSNWFTAEYVSYGIVRSERGSSEATLPSLLESHLYSLHPQLQTAENENMRSLYHRCVRARSLAFSKYQDAQPITLEDLEGNSALARCFDNIAEDTPPPLHLFLSFLGLIKRPSRDPLFMDWIKKHYTAQDIADCGYEQTTSVANNLPEIMQTIELARDACVALDIPEIPPIPVWPADPDFDFHGQWLHRNPKAIQIKKIKTSLSTGDPSDDDEDAVDDQGMEDRDDEAEADRHAEGESEGSSDPIVPASERAGSVAPLLGSTSGALEGDRSSDIFPSQADDAPMGLPFPEADADYTTSPRLPARDWTPPLRFPSMGADEDRGMFASVLGLSDGGAHPRRSPDLLEKQSAGLNSRLPSPGAAEQQDDLGRHA